MLLWANDRIILQPASPELNYEKIQTLIAIIKTAQRNFNLLVISLHVPNRLQTQEKET